MGMNKMKQMKAEKADSVFDKNINDLTLDEARRIKIRRIIANNFEKLVDVAGWAKVSSVGNFERLGKSDRMEIVWMHHQDETSTVIAYMCDEMDNDVNALNSFLYALAMIRFIMDQKGKPIRIVIIGLEISDELIQEFKEINFPFSLWAIRKGQAMFYPSRFDNLSELP